MSLPASAKSSWPRYVAGRSDYMHALGILSANFNQLEAWLNMLFRIYVRLPDEASAYLFAKFDNAARLDFLKICFEASRHDKKTKRALRFFVKAFGVCAENRNIIIHSQAVAVRSTTSKRERILLAKAVRKMPFGNRTYMPSIRQLRSIADEIHAVADYGSNLGIFIWRTYEPLLPLGTVPQQFSRPQRPLLPKSLSQRFPQVRTARRPLLRSSGVKIIY